MENKTGFVNWLFSDAGAGWVFGLVSLIALLISALKKKASQKIVFQELNRQSLLFINENVRDKVSISFSDQPVKKLSQIQAHVFNSGIEIIKSPVFTISVPGVTKFLDVSVSGEFGGQASSVDIKDGEIVVSLPFLNPVKNHNHKATLSIVLDGSFKGLKIGGNGEGWSLQYKMIKDRYNMQLRVNFALITFLYITSFLFVLIIYPKKLGIPPDEISWRAIRASSPFIFLFVALLVWRYVINRKRAAASRRIG